MLKTPEIGQVKDYMPLMKVQINSIIACRRCDIGIIFVIDLSINAAEYET